MRYKLLVAGLLCGLVALAQDTTTILINSRPIAEERYADIKGSPFMYDSLATGTIHTLMGKQYDRVPLNFNGYTQLFEAVHRDSFVELAPNEYRIVEITHDPAGRALPEKRLFVRGINLKKSDLYGEVLYQGDRVVLIHHFIADLSEKKVENVGETIYFKRFGPKSLYYLMVDGDIGPVSLRRKSLLSALGEHRKKLDSYIKSESLDVGNHDDVRRLLAYYESLGG